MEKELLIRLDSGWLGDLRVMERKNIRLRNKLEWLDAVGVAQPLSTGDAAKDSKAAEAFGRDSILVTLSASGGVVRTSLVGVLLAWVQRDRRRSLSVWHGEDILALKGLSLDQQRTLKAFLARHTGAAD